MQLKQIAPARENKSWELMPNPIDSPPKQKAISTPHLIPSNLEIKFFSTATSQLNTSISTTPSQNKTYNKSSDWIPPSHTTQKNTPYTFQLPLFYGTLKCILNFTFISNLPLPFPLFRPIEKLNRLRSIWLIYGTLCLSICRPLLPDDSESILSRWIA